MAVRQVAPEDGQQVAGGGVEPVGVAREGLYQLGPLLEIIRGPMEPSLERIDAAPWDTFIGRVRQGGGSTPGAVLF